ncbi:MAG: dihydroxyacetone kinase transcriptional activator DhaS [Clostridiales bacterium 43-6]|nr:MAG: dihydroxyacetone kinase transcriptional activator DhaS [Clostridiales bacterium 43-6]
MSESLITKKALSSGLKNLMKHTGFDKITIAGITKQCGLNRQTFYYHFQDKYELLNWICYNEVILPLSENLTFDTWGDRILTMLTTMKNESYFYINTLKSSGANEFEQYLLSFAKGFFAEIIEKLDLNHSVSKENVDFIAQFYSFGVVGVIVSWAKTEMTATPESLTEKVKALVNDSKMFAVKRYLDGISTST